MSELPEPHLYFWLQLPADVHSWEATMMARVINPWYPSGKPGLSFQLQTLAWSSPASVDTWSEMADGSYLPNFSDKN